MLPRRPTAPRPVIATALAAIVGEEQDARTAAREWMRPYCRAENYQRSLAAQGFGPKDWEPSYSDRLVDALVAWGSVERVRARIAKFHAAGADHVALIPIGSSVSGASGPLGAPLATLEALAPVA